MNIPRPIPYSVQEPSLLMMFTLMRLKAEGKEPDKGPTKPAPEIIPPRRDDDKPMAPAELPMMPGVKEIDKPGGGDEVGPGAGPGIDMPEMPPLPTTPETGVPGRMM